MAPQINLRGLSKSYRQGDVQVNAVDDVDLQVRAGDFIIITGRSGIGKTTLLSLIGGIAQPTSGEICIDGVNLESLDDAALSHLRARKIGFVFQFASLIPTLNVLENIRLPSLFTGQLVDEKRTIELAHMVGLSDKLKNYPPQLSGGQRRRVAIARAFVNQPEILLADEPTGDLDVETENEILALFRSFNAQGMTIILVTHSPNLIAYGNRAFRMEQGKLVQDQREGLMQCNAGHILFSSYS
ncbi:putative ABC transporter ATP-binding protein YknY [Anaerolineae bacterium]|nr:putative ABC transporter ATP-binding protein YknY [Anaerolineae bacterium]